MSVNNNFRNSVPSLVQPLATLFPAPIVAKRAPTANDINYPLGQEWVYPATNAVYFLTSVLAGAANWVDVSGAAGVFTSLTVNPGPTNLSTVGNGAVHIGNATNTGAVTIDVGTGNFALNGHGNVVSIASDAAANGVSLGSTTNGALTTIQGGNGAGVGTAAIELLTAAAGDIQIGDTTQTGVLRLGTSVTSGTINIGGTGAGVGTITIAGGTGIRAVNIGTGTGVTTVGIGSSAQTHVVTIGNNTAGNITNLNSPVVNLRGPIRVLTGAGAPAGGLALEAGDFYINTTPTGATDRAFMATGVGAWTNFTMAA